MYTETYVISLYEDAVRTIAEGGGMEVHRTADGVGMGPDSVHEADIHIQTQTHTLSI